MKKLIINKGDIYGRLTIIEEVEQKKTHRYFLCKCECGIIKSYALLNLRRGKSKSCGCLSKDFPNNKKHGMTKSKIYGIWNGIKERCYSENSKAYKNYGGRGIYMCDEWKNSFKEFYKDMGDTYKKGLEIDRVNNNLNYCKENCRWTSRKTNIRNRRNTIKYKGKCLIEWCTELDISYNTVYQRIKRGWDFERALIN